MFTAMKRYLILLAAVAMLAACNKDNDEVQSPTQSTTPKRLASLTSLSYSQYHSYNYETGQYELSSTSGSKNGATFRWSSSGLLIGMGMEGIGIDCDLLTIEYDGNKMKNIVINGAAMGASGNVIYSCSYTDDKLTTLYASIPGRGWSNTTLSYNPNGELISMREQSSDGDVIEVALVWENGNVIHAQKTYSVAHYSETHIETYDYFYDNMSSMFTGIETYGLIGSSYYMLSRNNVLRVIDNYSNTQSDTTIYIYDYDGDWPVSYTTERGNRNSYDGGDQYEYKAYLRYTDGSGVTVPQTFTISTSMNLPDIDYDYYIYGGGEYEAGRQVILRANRSVTYHGVDRQFMCWNDGVTDNPRTLTVSGDAQFIAIYENSDNK